LVDDLSKKTGRRKRHTPRRTCVGCGEVLPKQSLIRIVRSPDGVQIDPMGKLAGRGAYLHDRQSCWNKGLKGRLAKALRTELTNEEQNRLEDFALTLPEDVDIGVDQSTGEG
jgi:predicted RNA-binding protein YlxR (DUF448 family)